MGETHNIFISWSKPRAKAAALALREWLPLVLHAAKPWMSEKDIDKGTIWLEELLGALGGLKLGVVCLTPEGLSEPWVLFEVGVICRGLDPDTRIWTYLLGDLQKRDVPQPLGLFQHTVANEEETFTLLESVNRAMDEHAVSPEVLKKQFGAWWPELKGKLAALPPPKEPVRATRSPEEMFGEIVEAVRAGAGAGKAVEQVREELRGVREVVERVMDSLHPPPLLGGAGLGNRATVPLSNLNPNFFGDPVLGTRRGFGTLSEMAITQPVDPGAMRALARVAAELAKKEEEEKAARARRMAEIAEAKRRERGGTGDKSKTDDEKK